MKTENLTKEQAIIERVFRQTGEINEDIVGIFFQNITKSVDTTGVYVECQEFENSDTRLSLLKRDDRTIAGVVETRTEFNNVEFIKFSLYKDHPTTASGDTFDSVAAPKEEPKEITESELNLALYQANKIQEAIARMPGGGAYLIAFGQLTNEVKELSSLRDQLREKDEDFKWCIKQLQEFKNNGILWFNDSDWTKLDSLIKKSQKL